MNEKQTQNKRSIPLNICMAIIFTTTLVSIALTILVILNFTITHFFK